MAKERKASVIYEGDASQLVYAFPFDYLRKKFVKVEDIYTNSTELTMGVDYTVEDKQVRLVKGIPLGHSVKIYRETTTDPLVEWQDASVLRSADLSLQEVQLLHLAEETSDKVFDSGMSTAYDNPNCWDGQYKRIINALDPIEDGDVVTLRYIKANQDSLLNQLKSTGAAQNAAIVATGDAQNARLTATGDTQNTRLTTTGDTQNTRLVTTGNSYVNTMTTLRDATTTKATEANNSADLAKKWAVSSSSPDGATNSKSSKTWAEAAKVLAGNAAASASAAQSSATASQNSANSSASSAATATQKATAAASSASAASSSASNASTSATNAKTSETNAANSAKAAAQSAIDAAKFDPSSYYSKTEVDNKIDNVWNLPLEWDTLESSVILQGTSIAYDENYIPTRYRLGFLADLIKTNIETTLQDYALKTELPTKTSQLTNDSGFVTADTVPKVEQSSGTATKTEYVNGTGTIEWDRYDNMVTLRLYGALENISGRYSSFKIFSGLPVPKTITYGVLFFYLSNNIKTFPVQLDTGGNLWIIYSGDDTCFISDVRGISLTYMAKA